MSELAERQAGRRVPSVGAGRRATGTGAPHPTAERGPRASGDDR